MGYPRDADGFAVLLPGRGPVDPVQGIAPVGSLPPAHLVLLAHFPVYDIEWTAKKLGTKQHLRSTDYCTVTKRHIQPHGSSTRQAGLPGAVIR